ncbi:amino acid adenylation domain-containing protein, partial [Clostridium cavendishii DSM 21758]
MESKTEQEFQKKALLKAILEKKKRSNTTLNSIEILQRKVGRNYFLSSYEQKRLWFMYKLNPNSIVYNIHLGFRIYGDLKIDLLQEAINEMAMEQESLRTRFQYIDDELMQVIEPNFTEKIKHIDLSDIDSALIEDELRKACNEESYKPFDLENGPLVRFLLIKIAPEERLFITVIHHIIFDGWSMGIFYKNLSDKYNNLCNGKYSSNKVKTIQYADYAKWQRKELFKNKMEKQFNYWENKLENIDQTVEFPLDKKRPSMLTGNGDVVFFELDNDIIDGLRKYSTKSNCTINTILLAAFKALIYKYSNQSNITVGTAVANRKVNGVENIIGFFVNTIVLSTEIDGNMRFSDFLKKVKNTTLEAYDNEDFPFDQLVEKINPLRDSSRNPFFQLMFTYQNAKESQFEFQDLKVENYALGSKRSSFDVTLQIEDNKNEIFGSFEYNSDLFYRETIQRICNQFKLILKEILIDNNKKINEISILNDEEKNIILNKFNDTYVEYDKEKTIVSIFEEQVEKTPNNIAIAFENERLTYKELNEKANSLARVLRENEAKEDKIVAIMLERSTEMIVAIMGVLKSGAAYLPIDPNYPKNRIEYMLENSQASILLSIPELSNKIDFSGNILDMSMEELFNKDTSNIKAINNSQNLAYIIYTSGTTGNPKGVMIEHKNVVNLVNALENCIYSKYEKELKVALVANYAFDASVQQIFASLLLGNTLYIVDNNTRMYGDDLIRFYINNEIDITDGTPIHLSMISNSSLLENSELKLKHMIIGGDKLLKDTVKNIYTKLKDKNVIITNVYGPTECCVDTTYKNINIDNINQFENIPIGKPLNNYTCYILDKQNNILPIGIAGELCIVGDGLARGYLNNKELTNEKFIDTPYKLGQKMYKTGDLAKWLPDGNIEYLGRIDEQVKIRGFRIELGEIISVLRKIDYIKDVAVITRVDLSDEEAIYAYIVSDFKVDFKELKKEIRQELPDYMIPAYIMQIEKLPVNRSGKLDKQALPDIINEVKDEYIAPRTELEELVVKIFEDVIGINNISIDSDFFEIGGHSLRATKVVNRIENETGVKIPIKIIFAERTAESIAKYIAKYENKENNNIEKSELKEYYPMSSVQSRIFLIWQMDKENIAYNTPICYKLEGDLKVSKLKTSLQKIINRHEILRTCFIMKDGKLVQEILNKVEADYSYEENNNDIYEILKDFTKPFSLESANLIRMKVVKNKGAHYLLIDMHHIVSDGMSIGIFIKELSAFYNEENLLNLKLQYKDYSEWMRKRDLSSQRAYWRSQFKDEPPVIDLPYDYTRPAEQSYDGEITTIEFNSAIKDGIKELCKITGATEYMVLLASFIVLLSKYTRQEDIVVGTPISARTNKETESMMGMFVNTLAIREKPQSEKSFLKFISEIKESCLKAYENQEYPFEELVEDINVKRDFSRNPLFDVMFGLQNNEKVNLLMNDIKIEQIWGEHKVSKFDLNVMMESRDDGYFLGAEYCTALFKKQSIDRLLIHFKQLIYKVIANPKSLIGDINIITDEEKDLILNKFNNTIVDYGKEKTIIDLFEEQAEKTPDSIAVVFADEKITYKELNERANSLARILRNKGVGSEDIVGIMVDRSIEMIVGMVSILKAGGAYLPIDLSYPNERVEFILQNSGCETILTQKNIFEDIDFKGNVIYLDEDSLYKENSSNLTNITKADNLIYIIYTSGTTGNPKGVMFKNNSLANLINFEINHTNIDLKTRVLQFANLCFDVASQEILSTLLAGGELYLIKDEIRKDVVMLLDFIIDNQIKTLFLPTAYFKLLQSEKKYLECIVKNVNNIVVAGEQLTLSEGLKELIKSSNINIHNHYGPSETHVVTTSTINSASDIKSIPDIGKPIINNKVYIVDKKMNLVPINVQGELCVSGINVARGYLNNDKLSKEKFIDNPYEPGEKMYRTGDLAKWLPNGNIEYLGRIDEQIKIRGFRIELGEITNVLLKNSQIKDVAVITRKDKNGEIAIHAYIVSDVIIDCKKIKKELRKELPEYMVPAYIMQIGSLPLNRNGKLDKRALPDIMQNDNAEYIAPRNEIEATISNIFEEVTGRDKVSINADFFEIGGHSLRATKVANRIESETGMRVPIKVIFSARTVEAIAEYIEKSADNNFEFISKAEAKEYYKMSSAQKRMYLIWQMDKESIVYNMPFCYKLNGNFKLDSIKNVLQTIINRHEILRTCFLMKDGELVQKVLNRIEADYSYEESNQDLNEILSSFPKPFVLDEGKLIRIKVVKNFKDYYILIDMHHIVSDAMSMAIFINEFSKLYNGYKLEDLKLQYKDYSEWISKRDLNSQKSYWLSQFDDEIPILDFPYDYKRPIEQSHEGSMVNLNFSKDIKDGVKKLCKVTGSTEYMVLLSAFMVLLNKYTRQEDIIVGTPISGRTNKDMESMMGMFINILAMRGKPEGSKSFINFVYEVKNTCLKAYENQEYPVEELIEAIEVKRDLSRNPLFDIMFSLENNEKFNLLMNDVSIEEIYGENRISKFDFSIMMRSNEEGYSIGAEYCTALFKKETINRILVHFKEVICKIINNPEILIKDIEVITKEEKKLILNEFNNTSTEYDKEKTIVEIFEYQVNKTPNNIAVVYEDKKLNYKELNEKVNILARNLRELGIKPNDFVAISAQKSLEMIIGILGIIKAGAAYVPIDPKYPKDRINYMLDDCKPKALLVYKANIKTKKIPIIDLEDSSILEGTSRNLKKVNTPNDLLYVIYTSGTTGKPKGVMIEHKSVNSLREYFISSLNVKPTDKILQFFNISFDGSVWDIMMALLTGATLHVVNQDNIIDLNYLSQSIKNTTIITVPPQYYQQLETIGQRLTITAGSESSKELVRKAIDTGSLYINAYGPTEATVCATQWFCNKNDIIPERIPIGKPITNKQIYICNKTNLCGIGIPGELCIAGEGIARGYLNKPKLTAEKFIDNPYGEGKIYRTGDLAKWLPDGNIEYLGRIDEQVKIRGFRIELEEIASTLRKIDYIQDVAVITRDISSSEKAIYAYLVSNENLDFKEIKKELRKELPEYMVPAYMVQLKEIPVTRNGKLDKRALPDIVGENKEKYTPPRNEIEKIIIKIFEEILQKEKISVDADFFEIGGHSLRATKVVNRIQAEIGVRIPIKIIFSKRTAEAIAEYIEKFKNNDYEFIPKAKNKEFYPMSSAQKRMYLIWQMDKESITYNMPFCYKLQGNVKVNNIKIALQKMIDRHEILRTCFLIENGEFVQRIIDKIEADYSYEESMENISELLKKFPKPFILDEGNLVRIKVVKSKEDYYLFIDMHHIVGDGMSFGIFINEFSTLYNEGKLEELSLQYKDYSEWMRGKNLSNQELYWISQFEDEIPVIDLPYDYNRPIEKSYDGSITSIELQKEIKDGIKELCKITGATEYMILLASFMVVLHKYTCQEDIVVGTPISGRTNKDMESIMGMFINTLAMRGRPESGKSFVKFVNEVKESCLKAYENQEYPFEELVDAVEVRRDFSRNPLFDVMFILQNNEAINLLMNDIKIEPIWEDNKIAKFDLNVTMESNENGYFVGAEYCTALFKKDTINRFLVHFKQVLSKIIDTPEIPIEEIKIITKEEEDLILNKFNHTYLEYDKEKTIVDMFEEQVEKTPNNIAVVFENKSITYKELNERSNSLASILRNNGVGPDDIVGIMTER